MNVLQTNYCNNKHMDLKESMYNSITLSNMPKGLVASRLTATNSEVLAYIKIKTKN